MKKTDCFSSRMAPAILAIVLLLGSTAAQGEETNVPSVAAGANLPPVAPTNGNTNIAFDELVRLVQAGVEQGVILGYIENSLRFFNLDADRIIYLTDLGAPSEIIEAAMAHDSRLLQKGISTETEKLPEVAEPSTNQPPEVTVEDFYDTLSPYGSWIYVEGYGRCWQPTVVVYNTGWRPYCDNGRWVYTDCGWYWMSDYSWGWAAFHYGRWFRHARYGWCWWPDTVWSPSWVCWRYDRDYCGWAPLPPHTSYRYGAGIVYRGSRVSVGFNFGLDADCYTFVATRNFCDPKPVLHRVDRQDAQRIYDRTKVFNRMDYDARRQRMVNEGISPTIISTLSSQAVEPVSVRYSGRRSGNNNRHEQLHRNSKTLVVSRPEHASASQQRSTARKSSGLQQADPPKQRRSDVSPDRRNSVNLDRTAARLSEARVPQVRPSAPQQPSSAPQARQQRAPAPSVDAGSQRPVQRQAPQQRINNKTSIPSGNRASGHASVRGQERSREVKPTSPHGKSNNAMRSSRPKGSRRSNAADDGQ